MDLARWLVIAVLLLGSTALGLPLDGGRALVRAPVADTVPALSMDVDLWTQVAVTTQGAGLWASPLVVSMGVRDDLELSLGVGLLGERDPAWRPGRTDTAWAALKYRVVDEGQVMPGLAVRLAGVRADNSVDLRPELIASKHLDGRLSVGAVLGYDLAVLNQAAQRRAVDVTAGASYLFDEWRVASEVFASLEERQSYLGGEAGLRSSLHYPVYKGFGLAMLLEAVPVAREPYARLMFGLTYSGKSEWDDDVDADKVANHRDACLWTAEDDNKYQDDDGCAEGGPPKGVAIDESGKIIAFSTPTPRFRMRIPMARPPWLAADEAAEAERRVRAGKAARGVEDRPAVAVAPTVVEPPRPAVPTSQPATQPASQAATKPAAVTTGLPSTVTQPTGPEQPAVAVAPTTTVAPTLPVGPSVEAMVEANVDYLVTLAPGQRVVRDTAGKRHVSADQAWQVELQPVVPDAYVLRKDAPPRRAWEAAPPDKPYAAPEIVAAGRGDNTLRVPASVDTVSFDKSLWSIAASPQGYGDARLWPILYLANLDLVEGRVQPDGEPRILVPRDLAVPAGQLVQDFYDMRQAQRQSLALGSKALREIPVGPGESLRDVAARPEVYGDARLWTLLYAANLDRLSDPEQLAPGTTLRVAR